MRVLGAFHRLADRLSAAGVASPDAEAWEMIEAISGRRRVDLIIGSGELDESEQRRLFSWLARREAREPLQRITGRAHFYGLELAVEPGVLIPRPETERLVQIALQRLLQVEAPRVIDVGTGSGAVALAIKQERPDAIVMGTDVDGRALAATARNAGRLGLKLDLVESDLLQDRRVAEFVASAQMLVSNPPYLPQGDRQQVEPEVAWDPEGALYAGPDGLDVFRRLEAQALGLLATGSSLLVELDPRNVHAAQKLSYRWSGSAVHEDLVGRKRFLELRR